MAQRLKQVQGPDPDDLALDAVPDPAKDADPTGSGSTSLARRLHVRTGLQ
jgi:hypothetical protein